MKLNEFVQELKASGCLVLVEFNQKELTSILAKNPKTKSVSSIPIKQNLSLREIKRILIELNI